MEVVDIYIRLSIWVLNIISAMLYYTYPLYYGLSILFNGLVYFAFLMWKIYDIGEYPIGVVYIHIILS